MNQQILNLPIDEITAVALNIQIENQIQSLKVWQRKLSKPFLPEVKQSHTPTYPVPTVATVLHIMDAYTTARSDGVRALIMFLESQRGS